MSKPVKGEEAYTFGLVDAIVSPDELLNTARQWALDILDCRRPWVRSLYKTDKIEPLGEAREILKFARAQARKQAPNLQHPLVCIDCIEEGIASGPRAGLWKVLTCLYYSFTSLQKAVVCNCLMLCLILAGG
jgi:enoyl-CoA hydratase/3-hydroxyacyl-CoA dehydrogenase